MVPTDRPAEAMSAERRPGQPGDVDRYRQYWADELAAAALYRGLAELADPSRRAVFARLAAVEQRHAAHWARLLADAGVEPARPRVPLRTRLLLAAARRFGVDAVLPQVVRMEAGDRDRYRGVAEAPASMAAEEAGHGRTVALALTGGRAGAAVSLSERRHRAGAGGALRAAVFGVSDGLVSNFALVMGVAGGAGSGDIVLLAGITGLLAGAGSMAAGEWISVNAQRELYEREIDVERAELAEFPDEEREELELIFQAKGMTGQQAAAAAEEIMADPDTALDTLAREELGLDPGDLDSPWVAAGSSFVAFAVGAVIPVLPFLAAAGEAAVAVAAVLSVVALFAVGATLSVFTGRSFLRSGLRMVTIGALTAAITFGIGTLVGIGLA